MFEERIRLINVYRMMLDRCYNESNVGYGSYGGRGIYVDDRWLLDPTAFVEWSLANGSSKELQLDRVDNDGPYSPDNCRYVTPRENSRNRRATVMVAAFGEKKCVMDWLQDDRCVVGNFVLYQRISLGWDPEVALTTPSNDFSTRILTAFGESKEWTEWAKDSRCSVSGTTLIARINRGWGHEKAITTPPDATRKGKIAHNAELIEAFGTSKTFREWTADPRVSIDDHKAYWNRVNKMDWSPEKALTEPTRNNKGLLFEGKTIKEWYDHPDCKMSYNTLARRLKDGMSVADAFALPVIRGRQPSKPKN